MTISINVKPAFAFGFGGQAPAFGFGGQAPAFGFGGQAPAFRRKALSRRLSQSPAECWMVDAEC
jgi:hypothetical protein